MIQNRPEQVIAMMAQKLTQKEIATKLGYANARAVRQIVLSLRKQGRMAPSTQSAVQPWTEEKAERLTYLWTKTNVTAQKIGEELGYQRGAIIGKADRLGLKRNTTRSTPPDRWPQEHTDIAMRMLKEGHCNRVIGDAIGRTGVAVRSRFRKLGLAGYKRPRIARPRWAGPGRDWYGLSPSKPRPAPLISPALAWFALPGTIPIEFEDQTRSSCRWPIGHEVPLLWCGEPKIKGSSYCSCHFNMSVAHA